MTERDDAIYGAAAGGGKGDPLWDDFLRAREQRDALLAACEAILPFIAEIDDPCTGEIVNARYLSTEYRETLEKLVAAIAAVKGDE